MYSKFSYNLESLLFYPNQNISGQNDRNRKNMELFARTGLERLATTWVPGVYLYKELKRMQHSGTLSVSKYKIRRYGAIITVELLLNITRSVAVHTQYKLYQLL